MASASVQLSLTGDEARILNDILSYVTLGPKPKQRLVFNILEALEQAGVELAETEINISYDSDNFPTIDIVE